MRIFDKIMDKNYKINQKIAFLSAFVGGIFIHLFALVSVLHNYDNIAVYDKGYGTGVSSGRWLLSVLGDCLDKIGFSYNLPWICGVLFILFIALCPYLFVDLYNIQKKTHAVLIGLLCVSIPVVASTLFFRYTAVYYGISIFLAVLAAYAPIKLNNKKIGAFVSAFLIACSLGIYQANLPLTISIFVLYLMQQVLNANGSWVENLKKGLFFCGCLVLGYIVYNILLNIFLKIYGVELSPYQGIDKLGQFNFHELPLTIWECFKNFFKMPFTNLYSLSSISVLKYSYIILGLVTFMIAFMKLISKKRKWQDIILFVLLCLSFPIAVNFIGIMVTEGFIYTLMVYSFIMISILPIVLIDNANNLKHSFFHKIFRPLIISILCCIIFSYSYIDNVNYSKLYYINREVENYFSSMIAQIRMTDGYTSDKKWMFIGTIKDPLFKDNWGNEQMIGGSTSNVELLSTYSWRYWFVSYLGYSIPEVDDETRGKLMENHDVRAMPCWPDSGSIKVIDDVVVMKLS